MGMETGSPHQKNVRSVMMSELAPEQQSLEGSLSEMELLLVQAVL